MKKKRIKNFRNISKKSWKKTRKIYQIRFGQFCHCKTKMSCHHPDRMSLPSNGVLIFELSLEDALQKLTKPLEEASKVTGIVVYA